MVRMPLFAVLGLVLLAPIATLAQSYPSRPIRLIVPFGAGSITDVLARTVSSRLTDALAQKIVVDNRPGAGGLIGSSLVAKAQPDGYSLMLGGASTYAINQSLYSSMPYDSATAFAPITQMSTNANVLIIHPSFPAKSVSELIAYGKNNPGKLSFASTGAGGSVHLSAEMFKAMTGIDMVHVAYKASPLAHVDLIGGQVQVMFDGMPTALPLIKAGRMRALGVTSSKRSALMPELPTIAEAGLPGYEAVNWFGFATTAGAPRERVLKLNAEIVRILNNPETRERLLALGAEPVGTSPEEFAGFIKSEAVRWGRIVKALGLRAD
jgi:tripartite-type tricarboxylate transporter receptor subunit TctC